MPTQVLLFALGLLALYFGAEWLVRGAGRLARSAGISPLVVGLTVVAFGTSAPELVVSALAAVRGQSGVSLGNVVGSNILNIALILGLAALVYPLRVEMRLLRREVPMMIAATAALGLLARDQGLGRLDAALLLAGFLAYIIYILRAARVEAPWVQAEYVEFEAAEAIAPAVSGRGRDLSLVLGGLAALVGGAQLLVGAATFFARAVGLSELVIGLTIVAVGTSLPELATSLLAAFRREADIAVGNIVGSNIFNTLAILGVSAGIRPMGVDPALLRFELPVMVSVNVLLLPFAWSRLRIERWEGALLVVGYLAFAMVLIARGVVR